MLTEKLCFHQISSKLIYAVKEQGSLNVSMYIKDVQVKYLELLTDVSKNRSIFFEKGGYELPFGIDT
jgi:hypothetical protein